MKTSIRGFSSLIALLLVAAIAIAGVSFYISHNQSSQNSETPLSNSASSTEPNNQEEKETVTKPFLAFDLPIPGQIVNPNDGLAIHWNYEDRSVINQLPPEYTWIQINLKTENGENLGEVGETKIASTSYTWNTKADFNQNLGHGLTIDPPYKYLLQAEVVYQPKDFTCDPKVKYECMQVYSEKDQELMNKASSLSATSSMFTIDMSKFVPQVVNVDKKTTNITKTNPSVTGTSNMSLIRFQLLWPERSTTKESSVPVVNGVWAYIPPSDVPNGTYSVNIWDKTGFDSFDSITITVSR